MLRNAQIGVAVTVLCVLRCELTTMAPRLWLHEWQKIHGAPRPWNRACRQARTPRKPPAPLPRVYTRCSRRVFLHASHVTACLCATRSMQQQAQEALNSARQQEEQAAARLAACEKECRHAEQAASARLAEVQRREAACEKRSTELTVWQQELHQRVTALDTQDAELEEREEQLEAELAQHRAEVHAVTTQHRSEVAEAHAEIASSRMQLQQEMEALRRKQVASDKRAARALAATRLQAVWRADRDRLFAQRERTLAQRVRAAAAGWLLAKQPRWLGIGCHTRVLAVWWWWPGGRVTSGHC